MVDINADGYLDIYVCNSGDINGENKQNELFINNGDNTFTEKAAEYNLAIEVDILPGKVDRRQVEGPDVVLSADHFGQSNAQPA